MENKILIAYREIHKKLMDIRAVNELSKICDTYVTWNSMALRPYALSININDTHRRAERKIAKNGVKIIILKWRKFPSPTFLGCGYNKLAMLDSSPCNFL